MSVCLCLGKSGCKKTIAEVVYLTCHANNAAEASITCITACFQTHYIVRIE